MLKTSKRSWSSVRSPALMGGGTAMVGASGYAFVALAGHTLPAAQVAAISSFYLLVNIIGPGLFVALEQETNRATSSTSANHGSIKLVLHRAALHGSGLLLAVFLVLGLISPLVVDRVLLGDWTLFVAVAISAVTAASVYLVRGVLGGLRRFGGYSATLAAEGAMRLAPVLVIAAAGVADPGLYGLVFARGSGFGAFVGFRWVRRRHIGEAPAVAQAAPDDHAVGNGMVTARGLAFLVSATLLAQAVANLAPIVVTGRMVTDVATAAAFASAFILARIPLFVFSPAQALVLPAVSAAVTRGDHAAVRKLLRLVLGVAAGIGLAGAAAAAIVGPWAVQVFFGAEVELSGVVLGLLGLSTLFLMAAQILQAVLVAYRAHHAATMAWLFSTVLLVGFLVLPIAPITAAVIAQLTASVAVVLGMTVALLPRLRSTCADSPTPIATGERL